MLNSIIPNTVTSASELVTEQTHPAAPPGQNHLATPPARPNQGRPAATPTAHGQTPTVHGQNPTAPGQTPTVPGQTPAVPSQSLTKNPFAAFAGRFLTNPTKNRLFAARLPRAVASFAPHLIVGFNKMPGLDVYYAADDCFAAKAAQRGPLYRLSPRCRQAVAFERAVFGGDSRADILLIAPRQREVFRRFYGTPAGRFSVLPPGISRSRVAGADADTAAARRQEFRRRWRIEDRDILLLSVGSGFHTKGVDRAIAALASLPAPLGERAHLIIVGRGKSARYQKQSRRLGVGARVRFTGARDDVAAFMRAADALIHPARRENTGTVLLEALVAGLPVIASEACGYAPYIAQAGMGWVVGAPFAQSELNQAVQDLAERHDQDRDTWRARGRQFAATADIYDMPKRACAAIEAAGHKRRHPRASLSGGGNKPPSPVGKRYRMCGKHIR